MRDWDRSEQSISLRWNGAGKDASYQLWRTWYPCLCEMRRSCEALLCIGDPGEAFAGRRNASVEHLATLRDNPNLALFLGQVDVTTP